MTISAPPSPKPPEEAVSLLMATLALLAGIVEEQFVYAIEAILERNPAKVFHVNQHRRNIHGLCTEILTQANALLVREITPEQRRTALAGIRLVIDFERMSDISGKVAELAAHVHFDTSPSFISTLRYLNDEILGQINDCVIAYVNAHLETVLQMYRRFVKVEQIAHSFFREMLTYLLEDPKILTPASNLLLVVRHLEHAGELMVHVAETLHYQITDTNFVDFKEKISKKEKSHGL